jgi:hypothetical protein
MSREILDEVQIPASIRETVTGSNAGIVREEPSAISDIVIVVIGMGQNSLPRRACMAPDGFGDHTNSSSMAIISAGGAVAMR